MIVDVRRIRIINNKQVGSGRVIYWMSRDQRVKDNWALLHAQELARASKQSLAVVFCLNSKFLGATMRQYGFMIKGLQQVEEDLHQKQIPFFLLLGSPEETMLEFLDDKNVGAVVTDFDPLRIKRKWKETVGKHIDCALVEVDAHNIVPCWQASPKLEFGAYTIRPKIKRLLSEFFTEFPQLRSQSVLWAKGYTRVDWVKAFASLQMGMSVPEVGWLVPGEKAARAWLKRFISRKLADYDLRRNNPTIDGQSGLSPYLHFGQISAQRVALEVKSAAGISQKNKESFLEELVIRRELADNFCFYNPLYDSYEGFPKWAQESLAKHKKDKREYIYTLQEFEQAKTHDALWNAAQIEMVRTGKMHGYMRMYWAKKILEWSISPEEAIKIAIQLNDMYELDGRDPNGYVGVAWSIGGVHDRAWFERSVFGKVRYMNYNGCKSKFDVKKYIALQGV